MAVLTGALTLTVFDFEYLGKRDKERRIRRMKVVVRLDAILLVTPGNDLGYGVLKDGKWSATLPGERWVSLRVPGWGELHMFVEDYLEQLHSVLPKYLPEKGDDEWS